MALTDQDYSFAPSAVIRATTKNDIQDLERFAREIFQEEATVEYFDWKYFSNPAGPFFGCCAEILGRSVGYYGNIPVMLELDGSSTLAAQAVDAMILPEVRRLGLFTELNEKTYVVMDAAGIVLDYAFPNPHSESGFVKRLKWIPVGRVPRYVKILGFQAFAAQLGLKGVKKLALQGFISLSQMGKRAAAQPANRGSALAVSVAGSVYRFDQQVDRLCDSSSFDLPIAVQRSSTYLNWRYIDNPQNHYKILLAERSQGPSEPPQLAGYGVLSFKSHDTQHTAFIAEWLVLPGDKQAGLALISAMEQLARQQGCSQVQCWMLPQHQFYVEMLRRTGYIFMDRPYLPGFLRYTTPFIIRPLPNHEFFRDPLQIDNWYLTMGDHDYY